MGERISILPRVRRGVEIIERHDYGTGGYPFQLRPVLDGDSNTYRFGWTEQWKEFQSYPRPASDRGMHLKTNAVTRFCSTCFNSTPFERGLNDGMSLVVDGDEVTSISPRQRRGLKDGTEQQRANQYGNFNLTPRESKAKIQVTTATRTI